MVGTLELAWTAGFLEGEGSFYFNPNGKPSDIVTTAVQVNKEPVQKLHGIFGGRLYLTIPKNKNWSPQWVWRLSGQNAAAVMMTIHTLMSKRRQNQIEGVLTHWKSGKAHRRSRTSPYCLKGHVLAEVGTTKKGDCKKCKNIASLAQYYRRQREKRFDDLTTPCGDISPCHGKENRGVTTHEERSQRSGI